MMKKFWYAIVFFLLMAPIAAWGQQTTCDVQIRTANAMMKEFMQHVHIMSDRAARHYAGAQALEVKLNVAQAEIARLKEGK